MSVWTHVNASIRLDSIQHIGVPVLPTEKVLGKICNYEDEDTFHWDNNPLPLGDEGSLQYHTILNPIKSEMAAMVIVFWGDLRGYDNVSEILDYFNTVVEKQMVRSGILEIKVESEEETSFYVYNNKLKRFLHLTSYQND